MTEAKEMKIYAIDTGGETDFVAAPHHLKAIQYYLSETGIDIDDLEYITEMTDDEVQTKTFLDEDSNEQITFAEVLKNCPTPWIISSTAY